VVETKKPLFVIFFEKTPLSKSGIQDFLFNKPFFLSFECETTSCTFVPSMKDNGGETRRSGKH